MMIRHLFLSVLIPKFLRSGGILRNFFVIGRHFFVDYGWLKSLRIGRGVDAQGEPIPWFTYPMIDFVKQLDLHDLTVFEYGAGFSTLFWARRARRVISVESEKAWFEEINRLAPSNVELILVSRDVEEYAGVLSKYDKVDIIVIDGTGESRLSCSRLAPQHLAPSGFIILDNSDLWLQSAATLRNSDLIQVDFTGPAPLSPHWHTSSVFFSRRYSIQPLGSFQPHKSVAQPAKPWEAE